MVMPLTIDIDKEDEFIQMWMSGSAVSDMQSHFDCTETTVRRTVDRLGLERQSSKPKAPRRIVVFTETDQSEIVCEWKAGKTQQSIADERGASRRAIRRVLQLAGHCTHRPDGSRGPRHHFWKGGLDKNGYRRLRIYGDDPMFCMADKEGVIMEHRLVMARSLGRPLIASETVHHIDGNRSNNVIDNLQLRHGAHGPGVVMVCQECGSNNVVATQIADVA